MKVNELLPGRLFTIPGDWREYLVVRHGLCSTTIRTAPGSGREHTITPATGAPVTFERARTQTISLQTIVRPL